MPRTLVGGRHARPVTARDGKAPLRAALLARRAGLPVADRRCGDRARDAHLSALLAGLRPGARVASYASFGTEPDTGGLLAPGQLLPVLLPDGDLDWTVYDGVLPAAGPHLGVAAVADCDVVLVPALAVDRRGVRLGRGGGSFDRALARARGLLVALLHDGELVAELPAEPHDVAVHAVATPARLTRLG